MENNKNRINGLATLGIISGIVGTGALFYPRFKGNKSKVKNLLNNTSRKASSVNPKVNISFSNPYNKPSNTKNINKITINKDIPIQTSQQKLKSINFMDNNFPINTDYDSFLKLKRAEARSSGIPYSNLDTRSPNLTKENRITLGNIEKQTGVKTPQRKDTKSVNSRLNKEYFITQLGFNKDINTNLLNYNSRDVLLY